MKITSYIKILRPNQWVKNLLILFPPFFAGTILNKDILFSIPLVFISFSLMSSCGYIINDIKDKDADKKHSVKRTRGIASGVISSSSGFVLALCSLIASFTIAFQISKWFCVYLLVYICISFVYTYHFKFIPVLDIFFIAFAFIIRVMAGGEAFHIPVSNWLFLTVFMVALFLATGKRLGEMEFLGDNARNHRLSLAHYAHSFLDGMLSFSASAALVMYALYTVEHNSKMFYTVPIAAFGLLRYIYGVKEGRGDPSEALLKDTQIMGTGIIWVILTGFFIYG